jgi:hypothetical protein
MTEAEWLACADPQRMLEFLRSKISDRKRWLFFAASGRNASPFLPTELCPLLAAVGEGLADWSISLAEWRAILEAIADWKERFVALSDFERAAVIRDLQDVLAPRVRPIPRILLPTDQELQHSLAGASGRALHAGRWTRFAPAVGLWVGWNHDYLNIRLRTGPTAQAATCEHLKFQTQALRDLVGNPFRPVSISPSWLAWNDGAVRKMAQAIYDARTFDRLPLLADALEDAGCTDGDILSHCRTPGEHVRGCWVVDLLLGKS